jgi:uncharacterized protein YecT (DUF1311 family)
MRWSIVIAATLLAAPAVADEPPGCADLSSNVEIGQCTAEAYKKADEELNAFWPTVLASIDAEAGDMPPDALKSWKESVMAAQRAWITFKENDCGAVEYEWWGGSGASIAETTCLYSHTADRVADLKSRYGDR